MTAVQKPRRVHLDGFPARVEVWLGRSARWVAPDEIGLSVCHHPGDEMLVSALAELLEGVMDDPAQPAHAAYLPWRVAAWVPPRWTSIADADVHAGVRADLATAPAGSVVVAVAAWWRPPAP